MRSTPACRYPQTWNAPHQACPAYCGRPIAAQHQSPPTVPSFEYMAFMATLIAAITRGSFGEVTTLLLPAVLGCVQSSVPIAQPPVQRFQGELVHSLQSPFCGRIQNNPITASAVRGLKLCIFKIYLGFLALPRTTSRRPMRRHRTRCPGLMSAIVSIPPGSGDSVPSIWTSTGLMFVHVAHRCVSTLSRRLSWFARISAVTARSVIGPLFL